MKLYRSTFTVTGRGEFPIDMLRRDSCSPDSETDAHRIQRPVRGMAGYGAPRTITLTRVHTNKAWYPTIGRWKSFGWNVNDDVETTEIK